MSVHVMRQVVEEVGSSSSEEGFIIFNSGFIYKFDRQEDSLELKVIL